MTSKVIFKSVMRSMKDVVAFIPMQTEGVGYQTKVIYGNGEEELLDCTTKRYLKEFAEQYGIDTKILAQNYGKIINKKQFVPLPLTPHHVLIPFHLLRTPKKEHNKGWINWHKVKTYQSDPKEYNQTFLYLEGGYNVTVLNSSTYVENQLFLAEHIYLKYLEVHQLPFSVNY